MIQPGTVTLPVTAQAGVTDRYETLPTVTRYRQDSLPGDEGQGQVGNRPSDPTSDLPESDPSPETIGSDLVPEKTGTPPEPETVSDPPASPPAKRQDWDAFKASTKKAGTIHGTHWYWAAPACERLGLDEATAMAALPKGQRCRSTRPHRAYVVTTDGLRALWDLAASHPAAGPPGVAAPAEEVAA